MRKETQKMHFTSKKKYTQAPYGSLKYISSQEIHSNIFT